jgi:hypothetical protein
MAFTGCLVARSRKKSKRRGNFSIDLGFALLPALRPVRTQARTGDDVKTNDCPLKLMFALLLLLSGLMTAAQAQQTIFNVPTTDVLPPAKVYFELDVSAKPHDS